MTHELSVRTHNRDEFVAITQDDRKIVAASGVTSGHVMVHVPHTTAGVTTNENRPPLIPACPSQPQGEEGACRPMRSLDGEANSFQPNT